MKHFFYFFTLLVLPEILLGQKLPTITPPSPQAQEFMKYTDYPVNYSSGLPEVVVPIYTIQSKELSLPISLSYHASGFKPNEKDNYAGQGWTLNAGGRISRTINNVPDEKCLTNLISGNVYASFPYHCDTIVNTPEGPGCLDFYSDPEANFLWNEAGVNTMTHLDSEFDMFYYDYPGNSGKFIFERNPQNLFIPTTLPFSPIKINTYSTIVNGYKDITHFEITDENGSLYRYGRSAISNNDMTEQSLSYGFSGPTRSSGKTSWLLTEIISADKTDTISIEYTIPSTYIVEYHYPFYKNISYSTSQTYPFSSWSFVDNSAMASRTSLSYTQGRVTRIKFKNGEIRFSYMVDTKLRLDKVEVYADGSTIPKKTIKLEQSPYVSSTPYWYKLDAVKYQDASLANIQQYSFLYNPTDSDFERDFPTMSRVGTSSYYEAYSIDYWGFYNGANSNTMLLAAAPINAWDDGYYSTHPQLNQLYGTANRNPNPNYARIGVLRQITYPTGGTSTFEYEGNITYAGIAVGGLRVKKITHSTTISSMVHTFSYEASNSSVGEPASFMHEYDCFKSVSFSDNSNLGFTATYTNSSSPQINYNLNAQPITYSRVFEYFGDNTNNTGRIEHAFDMASTMSGSDIFRDKIPTEDMSNNPWYGLVYILQQEYGRNIYYQRKYRFGKIFENETKIYDASDNIRKKTLKYYTHVLIKADTALLAKKMFNKTSLGIEKNQYYWKRNYTIEQLSQRLDSITNYDYPDNSGQAVVTKSFYTYNGNNLPITQITVKSNGDQAKSTFTYPTEESCTNCPSLVAKNILTPVINKKDYSSGQLLNTLYTDYDILGKPLLVQTSTSNNSLQDEISYNYDNTTQNLLTVNKANDIGISYLWGYNSIYPIAETKNATTAECGYTGFENNEAPGWTKSTTWSIIYDPTNSKTGLSAARVVGIGPIKSFAVGISAKSHNGYKASVWVKGGPDAYIKVELVGESTIYKTTNNANATGWNLIEAELPYSLYNSKVTSATQIKVSCGSTGTVYFDDLRFYPMDAQMTTYTYRPLLGITSVSDINNKSTSYEYDTYGRLLLLRDYMGNIQKKYNYHYYNQPAQTAEFYNEAMSSVFYKQNCLTGWIANPYTYVVDANTFSSGISKSDANTKAINYINSNGQIAANANGTCYFDCNCPITMITGYTNIAYDHTCNNGSSISFYMVFSSSNQINANYSYKIATISGNCIPSVDRQVYFSGYKSGYVLIKHTGEIWINMTTLISKNTPINIPEIIYNL